MGKAKSPAAKSKDARVVKRTAADLRALVVSTRKLEAAARKDGSAAAKKALAYAQKHPKQFFKFGVSRLSDRRQGEYDRNDLGSAGTIEKALFHPTAKDDNAHQMHSIAKLIGRCAGNAGERATGTLCRAQALNVYTGSIAAAHSQWTDTDELVLYAIPSIMEVKSLEHAAEIVNAFMRKQSIKGTCIVEQRYNDLVIVDAPVGFEELTRAVRDKFDDDAVLRMMYEIASAPSPPVKAIEWILATKNQSLMEKYTSKKIEYRGKNSGKKTRVVAKQPFENANLKSRWLLYVEDYLSAGESPVASSAPPVGTRVKARCADGASYPGKIASHLNPNQAVLLYDDGDEEIVDFPNAHVTVMAVDDPLFGDDDDDY